MNKIDKLASRLENPTLSRITAFPRNAIDSITIAFMQVPKALRILGPDELQAVAMNLAELQQRLRAFAKERDWGRFHTPKNLAMALSVEAAELLEHFQWLTQAQSSSPESIDRSAVASEIADILIYLAMLSDKLGVDIEQAVYDKIETNAIKYPVEVRPPVEK